MNCRLSFKTLALLLLCMAMISCSSGKPVRHLVSDVCLITPKMTREEVRSYLGPPDRKETDPEKGEVWVYYEVKKSTLRKTPYIGKKLGTEKYDLITITFTGDRVTTCVYRSLTEEEFQKTGLSADDTLQQP